MRNPVAKRGSAAKRRTKPVGAVSSGAVPPPKKSNGRRRRREGDGPMAWLRPALEATYSPLTVRDAVGSHRATTMAANGPRVEGGANAMAANASVWRDAMLDYKRSKAAARPAPAVRPTIAGPAAAFVPGARNWLPLGPSVVLRGQTEGSQPVGGRVVGLAIAPGGGIVYAASANGGVFRSNDGGTTWHSLMDRFDLDPTNFASASLICGAVAIDPADPRRVYVGTGEGDTTGMFRQRVVGALPAYRGVGPLRSDDGGVTWIAESSTPDLAGEAFFAMAVVPGDRETVLGATTKGLYRRAMQPGGQGRWTVVRQGMHCAVVATAGGGATRLYCAAWSGNSSPSGVFHSDDAGQTWRDSGVAFPAAGAGRIALGVQPGNRNLVYAFVASGDGTQHGVYRLDGVTSTWKALANLPSVLPGGQGDYDLTIAVDPSDANMIYLGGDRLDTSPYPGSIWRCPVRANGAAYRVVGATSIGGRAHADVHVLTHTPDTPSELWCACDGGVFLNRDPRGTGGFVSQNNGLSCLCSNFIAQHPTDPNILFTGLQDNGTARTAAGPIWTHVGGGDGGYCLVNWAKPNNVLIYMNGTFHRSTTGGATEAGWTQVWDFGWATMTQPLVAAPHRPQRPADANTIAVGAGPTVYVSTDFGGSWPAIGRIALPGGNAAGDVFALAFASPSRLFVGTTLGRVFRADRGTTGWTVARMDNVAAGPLLVSGVICDVAVDWSDPKLKSIYVAFGGMGDRRRVWRFDGDKWVSRSGSGATALLDVEHNALVVDAATPGSIYVGADIGVWHSPDGGASWRPLQNGLPDAPVFDLQMHATQRLLRAATHGRGVYELALS